MTVMVVVIEDEPATRNMIVGYLTARGHRVAACSTLAEASRALRDLRPDAVVSDVGLPDGNGADFCLDNAPRLPHARWLIMSAQADVLDRVRSLPKSPEAPLFSVFDKPVPPGALDELVRQATAALLPERASAAD